jgi:hypothetical protein
MKSNAQLFRRNTGETRAFARASEPASQLSPDAAARRRSGMSQSVRDQAIVVVTSMLPRVAFE